MFRDLVVCVQGKVEAIGLGKEIGMDAIQFLNLDLGVDAFKPAVV